MWRSCRPSTRPRSPKPTGAGSFTRGTSPRLFDGNKLFDPTEVLTIWETGGRVAAWVLAQPRHRAYDAQVQPDLRAPSFEREVLEFAEAETLRLMEHYGIEREPLAGDAYRCDESRVALLTELGWVLDGDPPERPPPRHSGSLRGQPATDHRPIRAMV